MAGYSIDSAHIVRVLALHGHTHRCTRCEARMLVKYASNLCVHCFNDLRTSTRVEGDVAEPSTQGGRALARRRSGVVALEVAIDELEGAPPTSSR